ncbi:arabinase [Fusarium beomiforme]|uniref:Arabinase n=1 Tax=Fusarium beomiforme TaxID=44412 RepID=A0A9P5AI60_9HYPO|nr:arabinase [Fusarium beomiforme]
MLPILKPTIFLSTLAVLPILTFGSPMIPDLSTRATAAKRQINCNSDYGGYAFLYFSNRDEQIYLAASNGNNALSFTELNNGKPILTSTQGDRGVRDPFILRSHEGDKFYILATDLCIGCGTSWGDAQRFGSRYLEIWESNDLITFSSQRHVEVSPDNYGNTWAPEAYYDEDLKTYVVYWASGIYDNQANPNHDPIEYQRMVYATTDDFVTFSEPKVWQDDPPNGRIDSTVIKEDGVYYRFTKATVNGCADIVQESSASLTSGLGDWNKIASCIGRNAGTQEVEGPSIFKTNCQDVNGPRYILLTDEFGGNGYVPLESTDLTSGTWTLRKDYSYPESPRHGTIIPLTSDELENIQNAFGSTA